MKVSNLIRRLALEVEQRRHALDDLVREAERLTDEIVGLEEERSILEKIATRYNAVDQAERSELANTTPASVPVAQRSTTSATLSLVADPDALDAEEINEARAEGAFIHIDGAPSRDGETGEMTWSVTWPVGPHYQRQSNANSRQAWTRFKLGTAEWYLRLLDELATAVGKLDRLLGMEMALDGAVQAIAAAFDACCFSVLGSVEASLHLPPHDRTPAHLSSWGRLVEQMDQLDIDLLSIPGIAEAMGEGTSEVPAGWLMRFLLLRDRSQRHDLLVRHVAAGANAQIICIDVPGEGPVEPIAYLRRSYDQISGVIEQLFALQATIREDHSDHVAERRPSVGSDLPNLLRRAGLALPE